MFNIGDAVWVARYGLLKKEITCPVCFGKKKATLILGDGNQVELPCTYCTLGYEPPRGFVEEYVTEKRVGVEVIAGREIVEGNEPIRVRYTTHGGYSHDPDVVFATKEEADAKADALCAEETERREKLAIYLKEKASKSFSWNAGYHLREVKQHREKIAYHERMAVLCKARARAGEEK